MPPTLQETLNDVSVGFCTTGGLSTLKFPKLPAAVVVFSAVIPMFCVSWFGVFVVKRQLERRFVCCSTIKTDVIRFDYRPVIVQKDQRCFVVDFENQRQRKPFEYFG
jgi:hypothetical protein